MGHGLCWKGLALWTLLASVGAAEAKKQPGDYLRLETEALLCQEVREAGGLLEPPEPRTRFTSDDPKVTSYVRLRHIFRAHTLQWRWYEPGGQLYTESAPLALAPAESYHATYTAAHAIRIQGERAAVLLGEWQVVLSVDGAVAATSKFVLAAQGAAASEDAPGRAEQLDDAKLLYQGGEFEKASAALLALLESNPSAAVRRDASLYLGASELMLGHREEARSFLRDAAQVSPDLRLDPARFPAEMLELYEQVRTESGAKGLVSLLEPRGLLGPSAKLPKPSGGPVYKKWWFWTLLAASVTGVAVIGASGGGDGDDYVPPAVILSVVTSDCPAPNLPGQYPPGMLEIEAEISDGAPPYSLTFFVDDAAAGSLITSARSARHMVTAQGSTGGCAERRLRVDVRDSRNNEGRQVGDLLPVLVCRCLPQAR